MYRDTRDYRNDAPASTIHNSTLDAYWRKRLVFVVTCALRMRREDSSIQGQVARVFGFSDQITHLTAVAIEDNRARCWGVTG